MATTLVLTFASDICKILLAIILPPVGVFLERGCNADFLINILLTVLGYIPVSSALSSCSLQLLTPRPGYHPRSVHHIQILAGARDDRHYDEDITTMPSYDTLSLWSFARPKLPTLRYECHSHGWALRISG